MSGVTYSEDYRGWITTLKNFFSLKIDSKDNDLKKRKIYTRNNDINKRRINQFIRRLKRAIGKECYCYLDEIFIFDIISLKLRLCNNDKIVLKESEMMIYLIVTSENKIKGYDYFILEVKNDSFNCIRLSQVSKNFTLNGPIVNDIHLFFAPSNEIISGCSLHNSCVDWKEIIRSMVICLLNYYGQTQLEDRKLNRAIVSCLKELKIQLGFMVENEKDTKLIVSM